MQRTSKKQPLEPLFDGRVLMCPHCRRKWDLLAFKTEPENVAYQDQTVPVYRCPSGHYFALRAEPVVIPPPPRPRKRRRRG